MKVHVQFFGPAAEKAGCRDLYIESQPDVRSVVQVVLETIPALDVLEGNMKYARNTEYASLDTVLEEGDTLSFLPPVGGG
tara:strand:- start:235 stop:474 length:240 start_codon:yes stop_codon:yes gene_type:complete